jgi:NAD(P)-dependent dehydrogenase (short-subunit alcohol dehydrogenase family)
MRSGVRERSSTSVHRNGTAAEVAEAVLFLISESASFLTGVALDVSGDSSLNTLPGADE